jgi:hypothetical protein
MGRTLTAIAGSGRSDLKRLGDRSPRTIAEQMDLDQDLDHEAAI